MRLAFRPRHLCAAMRQRTPATPTTLATKSPRDCAFDQGISLSRKCQYFSLQWPADKTVALSYAMMRDVVVLADACRTSLLVPVRLRSRGATSRRFFTPKSARLSLGTRPFDDDSVQGSLLHLL